MKSISTSFAQKSTLPLNLATFIQAQKNFYCGKKD